MSITQLQQQITEREDKVARIQQSKAGFEQQLASLSAEEHSLIVSARTGDEAAKARLTQSRQDAKTAEREIRDDASAIAEITRELDQLRASLEKEQSEATRQKLLREVAKFTKRAEENRGRISAAAAELRKIGDTCAAEAEELRKLLVDQTLPLILLRSPPLACGMELGRQPLSWWRTVMPSPDWTRWRRCSGSSPRWNPSPAPSNKPAKL